MFDRCVVEAFGHALGKRRGQSEQGFRRQLLGADLDQKVTFAHAACFRLAAAEGFSMGKPKASRVL